MNAYMNSLSVSASTAMVTFAPELRISERFILVGFCGFGMVGTVFALRSVRGGCI